MTTPVAAGIKAWDNKTLFLSKKPLCPLLFLGECAAHRRLSSATGIPSIPILKQEHSALMKHLQRGGGWRVATLLPVAPPSCLLPDHELLNYLGWHRPWLLLRPDGRVTQASFALSFDPRRGSVVPAAQDPTLIRFYLYNSRLTLSSDKTVWP